MHVKYCYFTNSIMNNYSCMLWYLMCLHKYQQKYGHSAAQHDSYTIYHVHSCHCYYYILSWIWCTSKQVQLELLVGIATPRTVVI